MTYLTLLDDPIGDFATINPKTAEISDTIGFSMLNMIQNRFRRLPVVENGSLVGITTTSDIFNHLNKNTDLGFLEDGIEEIMTTSVHTISKNDDLREGIQIMQREKIGCLPVLDENGEIFGIFTNKDLLLQHMLWREIPNEEPSKIKQFEGPKIEELKIKPSSSIVEAIKQLISTSQKQLIVEFSGNIEGVVSVERILRSVTTAFLMQQNDIKYLHNQIYSHIVIDPFLSVKQPSTIDEIRGFMNSRGVDTLYIKDENENIILSVNETDMKNYIATKI